MAPLYLIVALFIQSSLIYAIEETETETETIDSAEIFNDDDITDDNVKYFDEPQTDWVDTYFTPSTLYPSLSTTMMAEAIDSDKSADEQLDSMKEVADRITTAIKTEVANLLTWALIRDDTDEGNLRKKRSVESPMDSTQLVMRLLKHIKSNNEFQNIAIDKMMTAQEIADKYGIEYNPDPEILSDFALAANEHAKELNSMLNKACNFKNNTDQKLTIVPLNGEESIEIPSENNTWYVYAIYYPGDDIDSEASVSPDEYTPQSMTHSHYHYSHPHESYVNTPSGNHRHSQAVSQKSSFFDAISYPPERYSSYRSAQPTSSYASTIENLEPEPELFAEEYEETMSNRVVVERGDEPGSASVNHITTYSISEKSHFKSPQIEKLPQQMQYSFYLI